MGGPWEDYKPVESGPWDDYAPAAPAASTVPELRQGKPKSLWDGFTDLFHDPQKEAAKATEALVNSEALGVRPSTAYEFHDSVKKALEMKPEQKAKRDRYMQDIMKFNDTGIKDAWHETFYKKLQSVPLDMQIAAGNLLREWEELVPLGMGGAPMQLGPGFGVPPQEVIKVIADNQQFKEAYSIGKEIASEAYVKRKQFEPNVEPGSLQDIVGQATGSILTNAVYLMPGLVTGQPEISLALMGLQAKGESYGEQRAGGSDPLTASLASWGYGVSEVMTEFIPVGIYLKPGRQFMTRLVKAEFAEIPTEVVNTLVTAAIDKTTIKPDMTLRDALDQVQETVLVTAISTLGLTGASHTVNRAIAKTLPEGPAKEAFVTAKDDALDDGETPQEAIRQGVQAAMTTREGKAHAEQVTARIQGEVEKAKPQVEARGHEVTSEIDDIQFDSEMDKLFADETGDIESLSFDEIEWQEMTDEQQAAVDAKQQVVSILMDPARIEELATKRGVDSETATAQLEIQLDQYNQVINGEAQRRDFEPENFGEVAEQTVAESLKNINKQLGEGGFVDLAPLRDIAKTVWAEGKTKIEDFTARMKERLGDTWESVKGFVAEVYQDLKRILQEQRGSFSAEDLSRSMKQDRGAKKRIRKITGQTKGGEKTITETTAMAAAFKKAEQASKKAFKAGVQEGKAQAAQQKPESVKGRVRRITGQTSIANLVREDEALRASFKKAEQAGRTAYREGNKDGIAKAKADIKELLTKAREKAAVKAETAKDIKKIKKLAQMKGEIAVDYQKKIKELTEGIDFTKPTEDTIDRLTGLADFIEREGVPVGINPKRVAELRRLSKKSVRDMSPEDIKELKSQLETLTEIGKLKQRLKYKYKERERDKKLQRIQKTTNNLDPHIQFGEDRLRDRIKVAGVQFYIDTLHTPRVAELADNFAKDGPQQSMIREIGEAETQAVANALNREISFLEKMKASGLEIIEEGSESDIRMMIVMRYREGATVQAETLMKQYGIEILPTLTNQEETVIEAIRQDMEDNKPGLAAAWEEVENEIFPAQNVYFLPLKYEKEEEIVPDTQVQGKGRTTHTFDGFSNARRPGVKKVPRVGVLQIYKEAVLEQEWYKGMQPVLEDVKSVVLSDDYKAMSGGVLYDWWKDQIDLVSRRGWSASAQLTAATSLMRKVRHNINTAVLGYKLSTIIMQPMAVFDGMAYVNAKLGPKAAGKVLTEFMKSFVVPGYTKQIIEGSEALLQRQGGELAITEELAIAKGESVKEKLTRNAFKLISKTDLKTAAAVQEAARKVMIADGMTKSEALKEAEFVMKLSQGDASVTYRPHILSKGEGWRTWFTFQSFVMNRWGLIVHDLVAGKIVKGTAMERMAGLVSLGILIMAGATEDEAREWIYEITSGKKLKADNRSLPEKTLVNIASSMPLFGSMINAASTGMDASPPALRTLQKGMKGADNLFTGKDAEKRFKGLLNATESGLVLGVGFPGTAQFFDLLESALVQKK